MVQECLSQDEPLWLKSLNLKEADELRKACQER
jgi:hypothetical protein